MARQIGIDIRSNIVRVAALRSGYRKVTVEGLNEVERSAFASLEDAVRAAVEPFVQHHESVSVGLDGVGTYIHRVPLPPAALKQVDEVLPFELEALLPVDIEDVVFDSRVLPREKGDSKVEVLAAVASIDRVRELIAVARRALGQEVERVGAGPLPLGNLGQICPALMQAPCVALLDVGEETSDLVILVRGTCAFARTLSVGVAGLPANAEEFLSKLRQTMTAWVSVSEHPVSALYLLGAGPAAPGMVDYLAAHLSIEADSLPPSNLDLTILKRPTEAMDVPAPDLDPGHRALVAAYGKAIGLALGLRPGARDLNLRSGPLAFQHGYGFLKDKMPVLAGLGAVAVVSFLFSAWAEDKSLVSQNEVLSEALATLSHEVLGEETDDAERALELLDTGTRAEEDPQPEMDAFDLIIALADHIPKTIEHDIQELDYQKGRVALKGIVPHAEDAQKILEELQKHRCFKDIKVDQIARFGKTDSQKYSMAFEVRCQEPKKKPAKASDERPTDEAE